MAAKAKAAPASQAQVDTAVGQAVGHVVEVLLAKLGDGHPLFAKLLKAAELLAAVGVTVSNPKRTPEFYAARAKAEAEKKGQS